MRCLRYSPRLPLRSHSLRTIHHRSSQNLLSLKISDPMILINNVASRYLSPSRIIIEFVDNSIDDVENSYSHCDNAYPRLVHINVHMNSKKNYVRIVDNARGMSPDALTRLVSNIGDSSKREEVKSILNVNGRFGFGMQSFRAAAHRLNIVSCCGDKENIYQMSFTREQAGDISPPQVLSRDSHEGFPGGSLSGTDVSIEQWKEDWLTGYGGAKKLHEQLQRHFERLLHRKNIQLNVIDDVKDITYRCVPMDYHALDDSRNEDGDDNSGSDDNASAIDGDYAEKKDGIIQQRIYLSGKKQQKDYIDVYFMILPSKQNRKEYPVNVFCNGRRVSTIRYLKSFMRKSKHAWIWNHPNLVGYVDASCLTPVITRDEFKKNAARNKVYQALYHIEAELSTKLENHASNYIRSDETYHKLESVINSALSLVVREEKYEKISIAKYHTPCDYHHAVGSEGERNELHCTNENEAYEQELELEQELQPTLLTAADDGATMDESSSLLGPQDDLLLNTETVTETTPRRQPDTSLARGVGLGVKFVTHLENNRRAKLVGSYIEIDVTHPDFETRVSSKNGAPRLTERLLGYIANVVSAAYRSSVHTTNATHSPIANNNELESSASESVFDPQHSLAPSSDAVYDEMLDTIVESSTKLEAQLQKRLPALQKEIDQMLTTTTTTADDFNVHDTEESEKK